MKYVTITAPQPNKYYVARSLIGGGYTIIATCKSMFDADHIRLALTRLEPEQEQIKAPTKKKAA